MEKQKQEIKKPEDKKELKPGDIEYVVTSVKAFVIDENSQKVECNTVQEALTLSYLIKIWRELSQ